MRTIILTSVFAALCLSAAPAAAQTQLGRPTPQQMEGLDVLKGAGSDIIEPFKIIDNLYYVGARNIASYLIVTPQGMILLDTGLQRMHEGILANIRKLGFNPRDIKIMINSHAHFDHIEGHAAMAKATGATVIAMRRDVPALRAGKDMSGAGVDGWPPIKIDRIIDDGAKITLGGETLTAINLPGHTQGATSWRMEVQDGGRPYTVFVVGGGNPNAWDELVNNPRHPLIVQDTVATLQRMSAMPKPDIVLSGHPQAAFEGKIDRIKSGARPHPLTVSQAEWDEMQARNRSGFMDMLNRQISRK